MSSVGITSSATESARKLPAVLVVALAVLVSLACHALLPSVAHADQGQDIVNQAAKWSGTRYCWAGGNQYGPTRGSTDPENGILCPGGTAGFDCTGLTLYAVYQATGILLPHGLGQNNRAGGTPIARANLLPGDIVFFGPSLANYTHAGIYIGGNKMWDAQTEGVPVQIHTLYSNYVGATRYGTRGGGSSGIGEGSFISPPGGGVYRIAGGAPLYLSSWNVVGGPQPTTGVSQDQFNALRPYPADGTILGASNGGIFVTAGGAPIYVSSWDALGGPKPSVPVDTWDIDNAGNPITHLRSVPADGTQLDASGGGVYIVAGGAPIYLSNWSVIGGPHPGVGVDSWSIDHAGTPASHLNAVPADGTLLGASGGGIFRVAGGAPIYVSNWDSIGGPQPSVAVDKWSIDNATNPAAHLRQYPADGTLVGGSDGGIYVIAGGAPMYVSSWGAIGGPKPSVPIDSWSINHPEVPDAHLRRYPVDGTFLNTSLGQVYRVAGGTPFGVSAWSIFGGMQPYTTIDQWDIDNQNNPAAHLRPSPLDGTVVHGIPSNSYWTFESGYRHASSAANSAVAIDDFGLSKFKLATGSGPATSTGKRARALKKCQRIYRKPKRVACRRRAHRLPR